MRLCRRCAVPILYPHGEKLIKIDLMVGMEDMEYYKYPRGISLGVFMGTIFSAQQPILRPIHLYHNTLCPVLLTSFYR